MHRFGFALACVVLCVVLAAGAPTSSFARSPAARSAFEQWQLVHNVQYPTESEEQHRFSVFAENLAFIDEWNSHEGRHRVAMNKFGDLTAVEYAKRVSSRSGKSGRKSAVSADYNNIVDWRTKGAVGLVQTDDNSGNGCAIPTAGAIGGCAAIANGKGKYTAVSHEQLYSCSNSCLSGAAWKYAVQAGGLLPAGQSAPCQGGQWAVTLSGFSQVKAGSEDDLQATVNITTPQATIDASHSSFQFYSEGVYYEPACSSSQLDLPVLVVGYGVDASNDDYWIVQNAWGDEWGMDGYVLMARNKGNNCGIATLAFYGTGCHTN